MQQSSKPVIAIDGTAASGKGTLCRRLGKTLGFAVLDTGKLYRLIGMRVLNKGIDPQDEDAVTQIAQSLQTGLSLDELSDPQLQSDEAGTMASITGQYAGVRQALLDFQRHFAAHPPEIAGIGAAKGAILDGRDIGTVIAPDADVKIFVTADLQIRAKRRYKELQSKGIPVTYDAVFEDMKARDVRDSSRSSAPMLPAEDAHQIDTSDMTIDQAFDKAISIINDAL